MAAVNAVTAICLILLTAEVFYVAVNVIVKKRPEKIAFIRGFKKGKFAFVYLAAVPLFCAGHMYAGRDFLASFFDAINQTVNLVILKYSTASVTLLMEDSAFFTATMYYCFFLVAINAVLFTISLTGQRLWLFAQSVTMRFSAKERLIVFGTGRDCEAVYRSDGARAKALVGDFSHDDAAKLYSAKINYIRTKTPERVAERLVAACAERGKSSVVVINTGDEERNIALCGAFIRGCDALGEKAAGMFGKLRVYVFGDPQYETTYYDIMERSHGCIRYVNKYQKVAMNFVEKYPFALFMDEEQLDYSAAKVRAGVDINVAMIGFGKTNRQIFLTSVANNQFITEREGGTELKKVHYHIFDKNPAENNKNLNHSYYRYKQEREGYDTDAYLPLPSLPADESYHKLDINDTHFYNVLHDAFMSEKNSVNFAVIAFGSDLENIDFAQKLLDKRAEWGVKNLVVFVKTRKDHKDLAVLNAPGCYAIGNERECVFDIREIVGDSIYRMARLRNAVYDVEYLVTCGEGIKPTSDMVAKSKAASDREWYTVRSQLERESSLYCCLSVRSKLNLMGLDCVPKGTRGRRPLTEEEYLARYAKGDMPDFDTYGVEVDGKKVVHYDLDFKPSLRTDLAVHEHLRWNSFMISKGMVPADKERILNETVTRADGSVRYTNGKNYALRRHGNLTTFEGLEEFRRMVAERDGRSEEEKDVIKYDYQLMDDAWWLLNKGGYIIVEKDR